MKEQLSKIEKDYLDAQVDDLLRTFKFQTKEEIYQTFYYITRRLVKYENVCLDKIEKR